MRLAAEAEKGLLEQFPENARELVRLQSMREREDLKPITRMKWILAEAIRLTWLAAELLFRRHQENEKRPQRVGQREARRVMWYKAHRHLLMARKNSCRQRRLLMLRSDIPPEDWLRAAQAPRPTWFRD
jgi:hypothetical protein